MKQSRKNAALQKVRVASPVGDLIISADGKAVCAITNASPEDAVVPERTESVLLAKAAQQMQEYFAGKRKTFTFPMSPRGTAFQKAVWDELLKIPYGTTATYGQIAAAVGNPKAARAVGMACNRNPIWIAVPCHRVVGANCALVGYALGTGMKRALLDLESNEKPM
ncbi:MAG TPA: methylated-DNA--[protein]-cysteine S-methyltransferase [Eubacteriales bacterium]|nr:methylated-DNA--[protein]-cysteine S-methyltransferase [Eubacteriales bacterium]